jgi:hypothetical protein
MMDSRRSRRTGWPKGQEEVNKKAKKAKRELGEKKT